MSSQIQINYEAVYTKVAELRCHIDTEVREMEAGYRQMRPALQGMGSRTNAIFIDAMDDNQVKARTTADTLSKLLTLIDSSARDMERHDQMMARAFLFPAHSRTLASSRASAHESDRVFAHGSAGTPAPTPARATPAPGEMPASSLPGTI